MWIGAHELERDGAACRSEMNAAGSQIDG
jgi:hypothetical protein